MKIDEIKVAKTSKLTQFFLKIILEMRKTIIRRKTPINLLTISKVIGVTVT
jgi:hypothetical protein